MTEPSPAGRIVRPEKNGGTKVVRVASREGSALRWSEAAEERFLAVLGETCNVKAAAAAAGFSTTAIYKRRARWPGFAAAWDAAIALGYARLEARLVELATDSLRAPADDDADAGGCDDEAVEEQGAGLRGSRAPGPRMTVREAMNLLRLHRAAVRGGAPQRYGWRAAAPDPEAMNAAILRKIAAIRRARDLAAVPGEPARPAAAEEGAA